jgi:hypothetical protein
MLITGIIGIFAPIVGGVLYGINPDYIWWASLAIEALLITPAMIFIPEPKGK